MNQNYVNFNNVNHVYFQNFSFLLHFSTVKKPVSSVPILPNVPNPNANGFLNRPLSVENSHKTSNSNHSNGKSNEFKTHLNSTSQFSVDSNSSSNKKIKNFLPDKQVNVSKFYIMIVD